MINLDALKIVLFDFDDTLAIWNTHKCREDDAEYVRTVIDFGTLTWQQCKPNKQMKQFMQMCKDKNIRMGLISKTCTVLHMQGKQQWIKENLPCVSEFHCVKYGTPKQSVCKIKESILIDDNAEVRAAWNGETIDANKDIMKELKKLLAFLKEVC